MNADFLNIASMFKTNTDLFKKVIQGIPPDRWLTTPGNDSNHLMWIAGHVVVGRATVLKTLGSEWSAPWPGLFARGAKLVDPEQYPGPAEIGRAWDEVSDKLSASLSSVWGDTLAKPVSKGLPSLDGKIGGTIAFFSLHETYHVGQMAYLRKWLGYGQVVGSGIQWGQFYNGTSQRTNCGFVVIQ
jgi:hypothetical protein